MQAKVRILMQLLLSRMKDLSTIVMISGRVVVAPAAGQEVKVQRNKWEEQIVNSVQFAEKVLIQHNVWC